MSVKCKIIDTQQRLDESFGSLSIEDINHVLYTLIEKNVCIGGPLIKVFPNIVVNCVGTNNINNR